MYCTYDKKERSIYLKDNNMENENLEQRNYIKPAWPPTEEQQASEKQIINDEPATTNPESDKTDNE
jgi:hypothetical protein